MANEKKRYLQSTKEIKYIIGKRERKRRETRPNKKKRAQNLICLDIGN